MLEASENEMYELKKVGNHWLIGKRGKRFKRLTALAKASQVELSDNFLIVDDSTIYEIHEDGGEVILVELDDTPVYEKPQKREDIKEKVDAHIEVTFRHKDDGDSVAIPNERNTLSVQNETKETTERATKTTNTSFVALQDNFCSGSSAGNKQAHVAKTKKQFPVLIFYEQQNDEGKEKREPVIGAQHSDSFKDSLAAIENDGSVADTCNSYQKTTAGYTKPTSAVKVLSVAGKYSEKSAVGKMSNLGTKPYGQGQTDAKNRNVSTSSHAAANENESLPDESCQALSSKKNSGNIKSDDDRNTDDELEMGQTEYYYESLEAGNTEETSVIETIAPSDEKDSGQEQRENSRHMDPGDNFAKYVAVWRVPTHHDKSSFEVELFKEGVFPVRKPKLIYCKGSEKALLICQSESDAVELSQYVGLEPFVFIRVKKKDTSFLNTRIDKDIIQKIRKEKRYDSLKKKLKLAEIEIRTESPFEIVAPTPYQLKYARMTIEELSHMGITSSGIETAGAKAAFNISPRKASGYEKFEVVNDVKELVWKIVSCSDEYRALLIKCEDIFYFKGSITFVLSDEEPSKEISQVKVLIASLEESEIEVIPVQEPNSDIVNQWCSEIKDKVGYDCCKYISEEKQITVYCKTYENCMVAKHLILLKTGRIKSACGRRRRRPTKQDTSSFTFNWETDANYVERYNTAEHIKVFAYEANILKLPVDCIVNAANDRLQHGGGVAAVIENAAGSSLTREGDRYIRQHGPLPVGSVMTTTAGRLKYVCVIHAVGPRWSDYYPHCLNNVKNFETHLYQAVFNSFIEAGRRGLQSVALPAISSAVLGVPKELCVYQYAKAVVDYSRRAHDQPNALKEIHFIDKNSSIVQKIQACFRLVFREGKMPDYDSNMFVPHVSRKISTSSGGIYKC